MGLYPTLDKIYSPSPQTQKIDDNCLQFSKGSQITTNFETVNDKVLREMNERARKQLENAAAASAAVKSPFSLGTAQPTSSAGGKSPQRLAISRKQRTSMLHKSQFNRMDSIESHPKVLARNSRVNLRKEFADPSPPKRGPGEEAEESPTKRVRQEDKTVPILKKMPSQVLRQAPQTACTSRTKIEPTKRRSVRVGVTNNSSSLAKSMSAKQTSIKPSRSIRDIRSHVTGPGTTGAARPPLASPAPLEPPMVAKSMPRQRCSSIVSSTPRIRPSKSIQSLPRHDMSDMEMPDISTTSTDNLFSEVQNLPRPPQHQPSYARPTQSTLRRSQSHQVLKERTEPKAVQHGPNKVQSMLGAMPRVPRRKFT